MKAPISHRYLTSLQTRGGVGKSTVFAALAQYCEQRSVSWRGYDLDPDHRNFSRLFPETVAMRELGSEPESEVIKIARAASETPVTLVDPRAHLGDVTANAWQMIRFPETFAALGGRITVLLFPGDDLEILTDIDRVVTRLGDRVDYVIVRNLARQPRTRMFDGSELETDLFHLGATALEIPPLLALARNHLAALEAHEGRGITHVEAIANQALTLDSMVRLIIEDWLRTLFRRFDRIAGHLLPTELATRIAPVNKPACGAAPAKRGAKINSQNL